MEQEDPLDTNGVSLRGTKDLLLKVRQTEKKPPTGNYQILIPAWQLATASERVCVTAEQFSTMENDLRIQELLWLRVGDERFYSQVYAPSGIAERVSDLRARLQEVQRRLWIFLGCDG